jgi:hypothetical protein
MEENERREFVKDAHAKLHARYHRAHALLRTIFAELTQGSVVSGETLHRLDGFMNDIPLTGDLTIRADIKQLYQNTGHLSRLLRTEQDSVTRLQEDKDDLIKGLKHLDLRIAALELEAVKKNSPKKAKKNL